MSAGAGTGRPGGNVQATIPKDQSTTEQIAAPVASLSSTVDPMPHYIASAVCGGVGAYAYSQMGNPRLGAAAAGFSLLYLSAARLVVTGHERLGYDLGTVTSLGLLGYKAPKAWSTGNATATTLATVGGLSSVANFIKSYQMRTGKPHEMHTHRQ